MLEDGFQPWGKKIEVKQKHNTSTTFIDNQTHQSFSHPPDSMVCQVEKQTQKKDTVFSEICSDTCKTWQLCRIKLHQKQAKKKLVAKQMTNNTPLKIWFCTQLLWHHVCVFFQQYYGSKHARLLLHTVTASSGDISYFSKKKGEWRLKKEVGEEVEQTRYSTVEAFSCQSLWYIVAVVTHSQSIRLPRSFLDVVLGSSTWMLNGARPAA